MKPESRENILKVIAKAKQQIAHLQKKHEEAEILYIALAMMGYLNKYGHP